MTAESDTGILDIPFLDLHTEPTVGDVDLGAWLGMEQPLGIRRIIQDHLEELQGYGVVHTMPAPAAPPDADPDAITEYHLTEPQALCLCQRSQAPRAAAMRRMLITASRERRWDQDRMAPQADVIMGPCSFPYARPGDTCLAWQGHTIDTDLSRLTEFEDVVALLPDSSIDIVRLAGPACGAGGRQGVTWRCLNPDSEDATPVMVIILGQIIGHTGWWSHQRRFRGYRTRWGQNSPGTVGRQRFSST